MWNLKVNLFLQCVQISIFSSEFVDFHKNIYLIVLFTMHCAFSVVVEYTVETKSRKTNLHFRQKLLYPSLMYTT